MRHHLVEKMVCESETDADLQADGHEGDQDQEALTLTPIEKLKKT